jgi:hypothetical protein
MTDGEFIYGSDLSDRIRLVCAEGDVDAAVAFWGHKVREHLFPNWEERRIRIVCDISMGGNSQKSLKALGAPNNENLRVLDRLHAKVFWSPVGAVVCSANASANGIGSLGEPAGNLEAGVYYQPYSAGWHAAGKFVTEAFDHGSVIDAEQLARAPVITGDPGVRIGPKGLLSQSVFERVYAQPESFEGTLFVITGADISAEDLKRLNKIRDEEIADQAFEPANRTLILQDDPETLSRPSQQVLMLWFGGRNPKLLAYINTVPVPAIRAEAIYGVLGWSAFWKGLRMEAPKKSTVLERDLDFARKLCPSPDALPDGWVGNGFELAAALKEIGFRPSR